jgi:FkbM family methyltransferase
LIHASSYGSARGRGFARSLLPLVGRISVDHDVHGPGGSARVPLRLKQDDVASFTEIFQGGEYDAPFEPARTYVDAGANTGMAAAYFATQHQLEQMVLIEANPELVTRLEQIVEGLPHPTVLEHVALADRDGTVTFNIQNDHRMSGIRTDGGRSVTVASSTLRAILDRHGLEQVDILKMDIEGAEHEVLDGDPAILDRVRSLVMEVHGERGRRDATIALIASRGFDIDLDRADERADVLVGHRRAPKLT